MSVDMFKDIIDSFVSYKEHLQMMDLYCLGEPLLDPYIFERIRYVKNKAFRNLGLATNADLLDSEKQRLLLESGIDAVLFSIDGAKKETHESIRRGVNFDRVIKNCQSIIKMRDEGDYKTRFAIRFIRQDRNKDEWEDYKKFWNSVISKDRRDFITLYDAHSWGGEVSSKDTILKNDGINEKTEKQPCYMVSDILYILSDGTVPLCSEDWHNANYSFGNIKETPPIEIFNCEKFDKIREIHKAGNKNQLEICKECTLLYSLKKKEIV